MDFATLWLDKRALFPELIVEEPDKQTGIIVVVPAFNEPGINVLLDSLALCEKPQCRTEVIIVVNAPVDAPKECMLNNKKCVENIKSWKKENKNCFFRLFVFNAGQPSITGWGVGLARKTGMDEALRRFNKIGKSDGVIVSLDADCKVEKNYFTAICEDLLKKKNRSACSIYFEHPLSGNDFPENLLKNIVQYELHLRYLLQGLIWSGFPNAFHTVGSAIAFKAIQYVKAGGMNRKQAGEDFYFILKLVPQGGYFALNTTTVYPSPRESYRVPFGTGPMMARLMDNHGEKLRTYNIDAFRELRLLFSTAGELFHSGSSEVENYYEILPPGLKSFTGKKEWLTKIEEIKNNTSSEESFLKRFFGWFSMFRIVKYLNFVHTDMFEKQPVAESATTLLSITGQKINSEDPRELLIYFRNMEKGNSPHAGISTLRV
jgi:hypothetical protein